MNKEEKKSDSNISREEQVISFIKIVLAVLAYVIVIAVITFTIKTNLVNKEKKRGGETSKNRRRG